MTDELKALKQQVAYWTKQATRCGDDNCVLSRQRNEAWKERDTLRSQLQAARDALERQADNMAFIINHVHLPGQSYAKFKGELEQDRKALAAGQEES